jgi:hypothetical protein
MPVQKTRELRPGGDNIICSADRLQGYDLKLKNELGRAYKGCADPERSTQ